MDSHNLGSGSTLADKEIAILASNIDLLARETLPFNPLASLLLATARQALCNPDETFDFSDNIVDEINQNPRRLLV